MMAGALLRAAPVLDDAWAADHALRTLTRLAGGTGAGLAEPGPDDLPHAPGVAGLLEDQVHTADAAIDAFEATGAPAWLAWAEAIMERVWDGYRDVELGGLFDVARERGGPGLLAGGLKPIEDAPVPSPNGVAGVVLARLHAHTGRAEWGERHRAQVEAFAGAAAGMGLHAAAWLHAADWLLHPPTHVVVTGPPNDAVAAEMSRLARAAILPRRVVRRLWPGTEAAGLPAELAGMLHQGPAARGYVCVGTRCELPADGPEAWRELLRRVQRNRLE
jgi:uncharacterized protein YyaL (SSP411 family)